MQIGFIVNLDKEEYLDPDLLGTEQRVVQALAILLTDVLQGGDMDSLPGRWAGDRIAFASENGEPGRFCSSSLNEFAFSSFTDISSEVAEIMEGTHLSEGS